MRRVLLAVAALAVPVSVITVSSSAAWAKTKPETSIVCKTLTGNVETTVVASQCTGDTGGSSEAVDATDLATGGTITWSNGKTTTIGTPTIASVHNKKCSGTAESFSAPVTADTTGLKTLGMTTGEVCVSSSDAISALKPLKTT